MIEVYHNPNFLDIRYYTRSDPSNLIDFKKLIKVAEVDTDNLEIAYKLTNNIEDYWIKNEGVKLFKIGEQRSTSVGDILVFNGKKYIVAPVGFQELTSDSALYQ